ncbi:hypothetical protein LTR27_000614 [Elasticomyces elasticus]|nr:hypothetical protein LTR27_000614 [Elasticomyces elasticus]
MASNKASQTQIDLPAPDVDILNTELFPIGRSLSLEGSILQAQNIAIDTRRMLADVQKSGLAQPSRVGKSIHTIKKKDKTEDPGEVDDTIVDGLDRPTQKWLSASTGKKGSETYRQLYRILTTQQAEDMAAKWYREVASADDETRDWSTALAGKYFLAVCRIVRASEEKAKKKTAAGDEVEVEENGAAVPRAGPKPKPAKTAPIPREQTTATKTKKRPSADVEQAATAKAAPKSKKRKNDDGLEDMERVSTKPRSRKRTTIVSDEEDESTAVSNGTTLINDSSADSADDD